MKAWYLLYCKPRSELRAQQNLTLQGIETFLPMFIEQKKQRSGKLVASKSVLFPSYLFIYFDPLETSVSRIHSTRGVNRIVGCNEDMTPIDDRVIHTLRMRELKLVTLPAAPLPFVKGEKVRFNEGPFAELEAVFEENCAHKRCSVLFNIMGQQKRIVVAVEAIDRICA